MELALDPASEQSVLTALREGNRRKAAQLLLDQYGSRLYRALRCATAETPRAEDLLVEALSDALSKLDQPIASESTVTVGQWLCAQVRSFAAKALCDDLPTASLDAKASPLLAALAQLEPKARCRVALLSLPCEHVGDNIDDPCGLLCSRQFDQNRDQLCSLLSSDDGCKASAEDVDEQLATLPWHISDRLRRRLDMLCAALTGV
jgi:hypothetical protein